MLNVAVAGASGYIGGELLRILLGHPDTHVALATSDSLAGKRVDGAHPNLRGRTDLVFAPHDALATATSPDVLFLAMPHTKTMARMRDYRRRAGTVIDLSGDFRLGSTEEYRRYYGVPHEAADLLPHFVTGLPEYHRERLREADLISVPGCMATAGMLATVPAVEAGLADGEVLVDARTGSSGSGVTAGPSNLHAERSGAMRLFAPTEHRHEAEIAQALGVPVRMNATGVEAVRGVQVVCRLRLHEGVDEAQLRRAYTKAYAAEPFVRVVARKRGDHRLPEPKILSGSNYCDVGFALAKDGTHAVAVGALDNLVKGGAGNAVQCMNIRFGRPETSGLEFSGLHPN
ncbi:N-acetyl-gamma-glutamyl-phosphate reductase [Streptomyces sp. G44]|uniref:N-acetyl-gamma-glutamyl-phosphate reductase n=1 Tax=Streptomyces sp. G44 TaxID=2807632 RepID=UPI00195F9797|nr:N-acetyl-gamma-glutamyl-phosphate reductase [Streptomyces sp. G44]MBM7172717.1 N-acetyl-gamma-glutamyl-phosphate reductase [Streptomyces sp. G44]